MTALIKLPTVIKMTSLSRSAIYQRIKEGQFPAQIKIGRRSVAWSESRVQNWIQEQIQQQ